jgi:hypothetical protein
MTDLFAAFKFLTRTKEEPSRGGLPVAHARARAGEFRLEGDTTSLKPESS